MHIEIDIIDYDQVTEYNLGLLTKKYKEKVKYLLDKSYIEFENDWVGEEKIARLYDYIVNTDLGIVILPEDIARRVIKC